MALREYGKESFDLKLFIYQCARRLHLVCLGALLGLALIGGGYYVAKVVWSDPTVYRVVDKYYVEYGVDPQIQNTYSYFAGYTWNDWITSDEWVEPVLERLPFSMTKEELVSCISADLKSDVRIPYITVECEDGERALEIAACYRQSMFDFGKSQKELVEIRLMDTEGPDRVVRDIRVVRACVLGLVVGAFFTWFFIGFAYLVDEKIYLPETITDRYGIPVAGCLGSLRMAGGKVGRRDETSLEELSVNLKYLLGERKRIGLTAVDPSLDLKGVCALLPEREYTCIPSLLSVPGGVEMLKNMDANLLLVHAGVDGGGAIRALLHQAGLWGVEFSAAVLVDADERLLGYYRFNLWNKRQEE